MPSFEDVTYRTPFGSNNYLRSTHKFLTESYTLAKSTVPAVTIDGATDQKVLKKGVLLAKITSGGDIGKVGPYQPGGGADEVQTLTVTGTPTGGNFTLEFDGEQTAPIAYNATAAAVQLALEALPNVNVGDIVATGGALPGTAVVLTFSGAQYDTANVPLVQVVDTAFTGGTTPTADVATTTQGGGTPGATDGRQLAENIVGFNDTFLPWQTMHRDVEVGVAYEASVVVSKTTKLNAAGTAFVACTVADIRAANDNAGCAFTAH